jgi:hypothetical protein
MDWLAKLTAWIVLVFMKSWLTTGLLFLAKALFSNRNSHLPPTTPEASNQETKN